MILIDVNLLIYVVNDDSPHHRQARKWWESALTGAETIGLPWLVILAFLRLTTRRGLFVQPLTPAAALDIVRSWLRQPSVVVIHPGNHHLEILSELLLPTGTAGNLTSDAHLAAMAIENRAVLCSLDGDFARFPSVRWRNPLR